MADNYPGLTFKGAAIGAAPSAPSKDGWQENKPGISFCRGGSGVVLASLLIISTVTALMTEQVQIIGLLKALGGTRFVIMRSYLISTGIAAITGTLGGIGLGVPVGYVVAVIVVKNTVIPGLPPLIVGSMIVTPGVIALSLFIGLVISCGAALVPLWQGTRITVREAMSIYGLSSVEERASRTPSCARARPSRALSWVPRVFWFGFSSIMHRRGRAALAILALSCAGALFLAVTTPIYALYQQVQNYYQGFTVFWLSSAQQECNMLTGSHATSVDFTQSPRSPLILQQRTCQAVLGSQKTSYED